MPASSYRVRRRLDGHQIQGKVNFLAPEGLFVNYDPADMAEPSLKKASGTKAFMLRRQTVENETLFGQIVINQAFPNGQPMQNPAIVGDHVAASRVAEAELEGPELVLTSGTGVLDADTAIGTEISTNLGRISAKQNGEEVIGHLRALLTPEDSGNTKRFLVEFIL